MTGGEFPPFPVTEKVSVRHSVAKFWGIVPAAARAPFNVKKAEDVRVLGPLMTKLLKSRRSCNI
jgi:hypothetical protein